ncbi:MAG: hypothetical protein M1546_09185 [Chloroflexi bacterium]|nr:hypothetical protein [Chloroflexota bacterium]
MFTCKREDCHVDRTEHSFRDIDIHQFTSAVLKPRLSVLGLTTEDQAELKELVRRVTQNMDVAEVANKIVNRQTASPVAAAIAALVLQGRGSKKAILLGALFGAYATLDTLNQADSNALQNTLQAVSAGAVAAATIQFTQEQSETESWRLLLQRE